MDRKLSHNEKRKYIPLPEWIEDAIRAEAKKHKRSWSREAACILETAMNEKAAEAVND